MMPVILSSTWRCIPAANLDRPCRCADFQPLAQHSGFARFLRSKGCSVLLRSSCVEEACSTRFHKENCHLRLNEVASTVQSTRQSSMLPSQQPSRLCEGYKLHWTPWMQLASTGIPQPRGGGRGRGCCYFGSGSKSDSGSRKPKCRQRQAQNPLRSERGSQLVQQLRGEWVHRGRGSC